MLNTYKKHFVLALAALFLLTSCEKELFIDLPDHENKLVVNGIQRENSPFIIHLSKSYAPQEAITESGLLVDDAKVEIWERGGGLLDELVFRDTMVNPDWAWDPDEPANLRLGHYYSPKGIIAEQGKQYELHVKDDELGSAMGQMSLPEPDEPLSIEFFPDTIRVTDIDGYLYYSTVLRINLPRSVDTNLFYSVRVQGISSFYIPEPLDTTFIDTVNYYLEGAIESWTSLSVDYSDSNWQGSEKGNTLEFALGGGQRTFNQDGQEVALRPDEIYIDVIVADKATYRYLNGIEKQRDSDPGNPFYPSEAIVVPSNLDNAYGVFGGITVKQFILE
jgi:hypothetical protein